VNEAGVAAPASFACAPGNAWVTDEFPSRARSVSANKGDGVSPNTLVLHQHPFAAFCWKALVALYELDLPFESRIVEGEAGRHELAAVWPMASIPVLRDQTADLTLPESSTIVEYVNDLATPPGTLIPRAPDQALQARLWDRILDGYVATPMQKIVGDRLRPDWR
jgi:glutathione S-transferase